MSLSPPMATRKVGPEPVRHAGSLESDLQCEAQNSNSGSEPVSACTNCRRRKLKCSKEVPKCRVCRRTAEDCEYDNKRGKTGMKPGAIETIHRRLDALETRVQNQETLATSSQSSQSPKEAPTEPNGSDPYSILSFFAKELRRFNDKPHNESPHEQRQPQMKRRRIDEDDSNTGSWPMTAVSTPRVPDKDTLKHLLDAYFSHIHPWIPMIHQGRLRRRLADALPTDEQENLEVVLISIRLIAVRFIEDPDIALSCAKETYEKHDEIRDWIILRAMKRPCVESLQALVILVFNDIGSGEASSAWSIIGSLTRTAEYLQLAVEYDDMDRQAQSLVQPYKSLPSPQDWTEEEERRRVFWTIFNLDRYCSVTMGWNTSLTSHDVNRRLPCDGITWRKEDPVETPFFGIWDTSTSRIGNPIAHLPAHFSRSAAHSSPATSLTTASPGMQNQHLEQQTPSDGGSAQGASSLASELIDMSAVGAFAYNIEATESLSRVNTYFLQQPNIRDERDLPSWITRFKELDLRLVHWKMFLPRKWKAENVTSQRGPRMDPNLTLAHITHNTSMILLYQVIAFPLPEWGFFKHRLPNVLSVDTCQAAAVEIATIAENFLRVTEKGKETMPIAPQFSFCVYIAGRVLLLIWHSKNAGNAGMDSTHVLPEFWALLRILEDTATRWLGPHKIGFERMSLAAKYSNKLRSLHSRCLEDPNYYVAPLGYTTEINHFSLDIPSHHQELPQTRLNSAVMRPTSQPPAQFQPGPLPFESPSRHPDSETVAMIHEGRGEMESGEMGFISQMLMDQQFMDLDRVISYDDGLFGPEFDTAAW